MVRASSTDLVMTCASAALATEEHIGTKSEPADLGTAVHEALELTVSGEDCELEKIAQKHSVNLKELEDLLNRGQALWSRVSRDFPDAQAEVSFKSDPLFSGTIDLLSIAQEEPRIIIGDWKSGRTRPGCYNQMKTYAALVTDGRPVTALVLWLRDMEVVEYSFSFAELEQYREDFAEHIKKAGKHFVPGSHCGYCRRALVCNAKKDYMRSATTALTTVGVSTVTPALIGSLWDKAKSLERALVEFKVIARDMAAEGDIPIDEKRHVTLKDITRESLDAGKAFRVLKDELTNEQKSRVFKISKTALLNEISKDLDRGKKKKAKDALMEDLRKAGATKTTRHTQLVVVNK